MENLSKLNWWKMVEPRVKRHRHMGTFGLVEGWGGGGAVTFLPESEKKNTIGKTPHQDMSLVLKSR